MRPSATLTSTVIRSPQVGFTISALPSGSLRRPAPDASAASRNIRAL